VTSPQRTASKTDRRFSGFPSKARKDQKISPVLLSVCTPPFSAKAKVASADATQNQEKGNTMNDTTTRKIAELNDLCRTAMGVAGKLFQTAGIDALSLADQSAIREKVETFNTFTPDNDPHGEHDFGAFEHQGHKIFWKIDYYDRTTFGTGRDMGSEDPSDPRQTVRVLTIMLASEY
jgi:hypothetical protein